MNYGYHFFSLILLSIHLVIADPFVNLLYGLLLSVGAFYYIFFRIENTILINKISMFAFFVFANVLFSLPVN
tara:strand:+ start:388 stop:603 length:216 start_codon:yes stop_codon:yes gene_type:complete